MNTPNNPTTFKVSECSELMTSVNKLMTILDDNGDKMDDGVYLNLYNTLGELYKTELLVKIDAYSKKNGKRSGQGRKNLTQQQIRALVAVNPDKYCICPICETGMLKENIKLHYQKTQKCKDIYYTKLGVERCKKCIDPNITGILNEVYGDPIPPLPYDIVIAANTSPHYHQ